MVGLIKINYLDLNIIPYTKTLSNKKGLKNLCQSKPFLIDYSKLNKIYDRKLGIAQKRVLFKKFFLWDTRISFKVVQLYSIIGRYLIKRFAQAVGIRL